MDSLKIIIFVEFGLVESCEDVPFEVLSGNRIGGIPPKYILML